ncbi:terpenoid synthase [Punctularia strigosozonata HHB-11173 SS5]|uniref:terpenoid synthase n=1 Tax=Punctularia strigosozonata (strain HHB-11173) TaxID=741275 RepID=UPI0004418161|nr:terpenoid synthase [Punctularia strigosozonata HHB-11173 SS5]EIN07850.1 terpenoid synthase [Punctularia strigosozonata HHB-11173 SS5]
MSSLTQVLLPDLVKPFDTRRSVNSFHSTVGLEASAWVNSFNIFSGSRPTLFTEAKTELLAGYVCPSVGREEYRMCCDLLNLLLVIEELSARQGGLDARITGEVFFRSLNSPGWHDGSALAHVTKQFRGRFMRFARPSCRHRFMKHCEDYAQAVVREAEYRARRDILDVTSYTVLKRENTGVRVCFAMLEAALGLDLPDIVFANPVFISLYFCAVDMVCWSKDIYSYKLDQANGRSSHNIITVLMTHQHTSLQDTFRFAGEYFLRLLQRFHTIKSTLPSWGGGTDAAVAHYVQGLERWVAGNVQWSFETERYFGREREQVKRTRIVTLSRG